jgi:hypothetical protein
MKVGQALYLLFVGLALYALNLASNGMLMYAAKYLLTWLAFAAQALY